MGKERKNSFFDDDSLESAAEYLRMALALLSKNKAPATPINYSLFYSYVAGKNLGLTQKLDEIFETEKTISIEQAQKLYMNCFFDEDAVMEELRLELTSMAAQVFGSLLDIAGKANLSNQKLEKHIDKLASSSNPKNVLEAVSSIIEDTREFVTETKSLEENLLSSSEDINKLKKELSTARHEATIDGLTGLNNRRSFDNEIDKMIRARTVDEGEFCMILADIDHFKKVNDTHGHLLGDKVLCSFAKLINKKMRGSDFTARFGGEEFIILLPNTKITNAFTVAENIRIAIEKMNLVNKRTGESLGKITASFGIAGHRLDETAEDLISRCDKALYRAKNHGRNRCVLAD